MRLPLLLLTLTLTLTASAQTEAPPTGIVSLASLRNNARVLLIFASKPDDPQLEIQLRTLNEHASAAADRDLVAIALPYQNPSPTPASFTSSEAEAIRRRFNIAPGDFAVILLGRDGGEKLRSGKPLSIDKLNTAIDAMPMRQDEMHFRAQH